MPVRLPEATRGKRDRPVGRERLCCMARESAAADRLIRTRCVVRDDRTDGTRRAPFPWGPAGRTAAYAGVRCCPRHRTRCAARDPSTQAAGAGRRSAGDHDRRILQPGDDLARATRRRQRPDRRVGRPTPQLARFPVPRDPRSSRAGAADRRPDSLRRHAPEGRALDRTGRDRPTCLRSSPWSSGYEQSSPRRPSADEPTSGGAAGLAADTVSVAASSRHTATMLTPVGFDAFVDAELVDVELNVKLAALGVELFPAAACRRRIQRGRRFGLSGCGCHHDCSGSNGCSPSQRCRRPWPATKQPTVGSWRPNGDCVGSPSKPTKWSEPHIGSTTPTVVIHCKAELMDVVDPIARAEHATVVLGVNLDDLGDHRPWAASSDRGRCRVPDGHSWVHQRRRACGIEGNGIANVGQACGGLPGESNPVRHTGVGRNPRTSRSCGSRPAPARFRAGAGTSLRRHRPSRARPR